MSFSQLAQAFGRRTRTVALACMALSGLAQAASIQVSASQSVVQLGGEYSVYFDISELSPAAGNSLAGFDFNLYFDPSRVSLVSYSFADPVSGSNQLDLVEAASFGFVGSVAHLGGGAIDAFGLSGNTSSFLDANQADHFRFLTLTFKAEQATPVTTVGIDLADADLHAFNPAGADLPLRFNSTSVSVAVTAVPEPEVWAQVAGGGLMLGFIGWMRKRKSASALAGALMLASAAHAQTNTVPDAPTPIDAVVLEAAGSRVKVLTDDARVVWLSTSATVSADKIGKRIKGDARAAGDTIVVSNEVYVVNTK